MKLLGTDTSPYVRKVRMVLLEKNIPHEYLIDPPREPGSHVAEVNPLGRIPALILDDGKTCVFDSPVIAEYVDTLNDTPILIPRHDALARMKVKRWEALADGIMDSAVVVCTERVRAEAMQDADVIFRHNQAITRALEYADREIGGRAWCEGNNVTLADFSMAAALVYLDLRQPEREWRGMFTDLAAWFARISERQSVRATLGNI